MNDQETFCSQKFINTIKQFGILQTRSYVHEKSFMIGKNIHSPTKRTNREKILKIVIIFKKIETNNGKKRIEIEKRKIKRVENFCKFPFKSFLASEVYSNNFFIFIFFPFLHMLP